MHDRKRNEQRDSRGTAEIPRDWQLNTYESGLVPSTYPSQRGLIRLCRISTTLISPGLHTWTLFQGQVVFWATALRGPHKKRPLSALRDGPRHTLSINIFKMGVRQLQDPGGPCWRILPTGFFRHSRRFLAESPKIETVGGNPVGNSRAVRVTSPGLFLCVSFTRLFCNFPSFFVPRRSDLCVAYCIIFPQPLQSFTFDFWSLSASTFALPVTLCWHHSPYH